MTKTHELVAGKWLKWGAISAHPNKKAVKAWIQHVTDTHDKYGVDGEWLDTQDIDGATHMDVSDLTTGQIIKVSGASHSNKKHRYWRIERLTTDEIEVERIDEADVIELMESGGPVDEQVVELRGEIKELIESIDDPETLRNARDWLEIER